MEKLGLVMGWDPEKKTGWIFVSQRELYFFYGNAVVSGKPSVGSEARFFVSSRKSRRLPYANCVRISSS